MVALLRIFTRDSKYVVDCYWMSQNGCFEGWNYVNFVSFFENHILTFLLWKIMPFYGKCEIHHD